MDPIAYILLKAGIVVNPIFTLGLERVGPQTYRIAPDVVLKLRPLTADAGMVREVFYHGEYEHPHVSVGPKDVVVDIGGHIGSFACYAARRARQGRVISYEPVPQNFELLRHNKDLNALENLQVRNAAVAAAAGEVVLHLSSNTGGHSLFPMDSGRAIKAASIDLQGIFDREGLEKIDFLKIDAEGAEHEILLAASDRLLSRVDRIAFECHEFFGPERSRQALAARLEAAGYEVFDADTGLSKLKRLLRIGMVFARRRPAL